MSKNALLLHCKVKQEAICYKIANSAVPFAFMIAKDRGIIGYFNKYYLLHLPQCVKCGSQTAKLLILDIDNQPYVAAVKKKQIDKLIERAIEVDYDTLPKATRPPEVDDDTIFFGKTFVREKKDGTVEVEHGSYSTGTGKLMGEKFTSPKREEIELITA